MEGFGLNLKGLLFQAGNFLLLFAVLSFLFHKYFLGMIDSRSKGIEDSLNKADQIQKDAAVSQEEQRRLIDDAKREAGSLLAQAQQQAKELEARLGEKAQAQAQELIRQAEDKIERERAGLKERLRGELAGLVIQATEKVLGEQIPDAAKQERIASLVKELS